VSLKSPLEKKKFDLKKRSASAIMKQRISNSITFVKKAPKMDTKNVKNPLGNVERECYLNVNTFTMIPMVDDYFKKLAIEWIDLAKNTEMLLMNEFHIQKGFSRAGFDKWIARSSELQEAQSIVRSIIGVRRERGGLKNEYNTNLVAKMQHNYDQDWKNSEEWRANLAVKHQISTQQPITVVLEAFPSSSLVPVKKETNDE
jgi:hypothetical protein